MNCTECKRRKSCDNQYSKNSRSLCHRIKETYRTYAEFAEAAGVSQQTVSNWVKAPESIPAKRHGTIKKLLGISVPKAQHEKISDEKLPENTSEINFVIKYPYSNEEMTLEEAVLEAKERNLEKVELEWINSTPLNEYNYLKDPSWNRYKTSPPGIINDYEKARFEKIWLNDDDFIFILAKKQYELDGLAAEKTWPDLSIHERARKISLFNEKMIYEEKVGRDENFWRTYITWLKDKPRYPRNIFEVSEEVFNAAINAYIKAKTENDLMMKGMKKEQALEPGWESYIAKSLEFILSTLEREKRRCDESGSFIFAYRFFYEDETPDCPRKRTIKEKIEDIGYYEMERDKYDARGFSIWASQLRKNAYDSYQRYLMLALYDFEECPANIEVIKGPDLPERKNKFFKKNNATQEKVTMIKARLTETAEKLLEWRKGEEE